MATDPKKATEYRKIGSELIKVYPETISSNISLNGYAKASSASALADGDLLNAALGKLEKALDGKQASGNYVPTSRKINNKALTADISLTYTDVGAAAASHNHAASEITSGTLAAARIPNLDASKITSGTISIDRLPKGALERLTVVADQAARFALTTDTVQLGDTVKQNDTGVMYYVVDETKLNSADGYAEYTAAAATSVPWSGVTGKPSSYTPASHTHGNITNDGKVGTAANKPLITTTNGVITTGSFGTTANTFCQGNDSRLSNARTPTSHTHGNITNDGKVGTTASLPLITGTGGVVQAGSWGTTAGTFCQGNDSRLSDSRTPTSHTHGNIANAGTLATANAVVVTDANKKIIASTTITTTELGYLDGVTSNIQTQFSNVAKNYVSAVASTPASNTLQVTKNGTASDVDLPLWESYGTSLPDATAIAAMPDGACFLLLSA